MSLDFFTWLSIVILVAGSLAVFVWFTRDIREILPGRGGESSPEGK